MKLSKRSPLGGTNTSRTNSSLRKAFSLQHSLSVLLAFLLYFFVTQSFLSSSPVAIQEKDVQPIFFSNEAKSPLKTSLVHAIENAHHSVTLLIYNLCDTHIIRALKHASARGVTVTVIADPSASENINKLLGPQVHTYLRKPKGLMHVKILLVDSSKLWIGSANMSISSLETHGNLFAALFSPSLATYIQQLADDLIHERPFTQPPFLLQTHDQEIRFFIHPFQGKSSLSYLVERIEQAKKRVFVAMYTFTHKELIDALLRAQKRGVDVRVAFDKDSSKNTSKIAYQRLYNMKVPTYVRKKEGLLHHKFAWIDDTLSMGSCNWTKSGFMANCDCIIWFNPLNDQQQEHLRTLWSEIERYSPP